MPWLFDKNQKVRKRKRDEYDDIMETVSGKHIANDLTTISLLEEQVLGSRKNYNSIPTLIGYARCYEKDLTNHHNAVLALCRTFCRLMATGEMISVKAAIEEEEVIVRWLRDRYQDYKNILLEMLARNKLGRQGIAMTLLMQLVKEEAEYLSQGSGWYTGLFTSIIQQMIAEVSDGQIREDFMRAFVGVYDDIKFYTYKVLSNVAPRHQDLISTERILSILGAIDVIPDTQNRTLNFYIQPPEKHGVRSLRNLKKHAQAAWMTVLKRDLTKAQRKIILSYRLAPCFLKIELLMDFLTDSVNGGGSTALMALSGLFYLIQERNLDYPQFYQTLYSLLNSDVLHSKHRSRFFRQLNTFLGSTHLPAALIASFIKRLSRLCLHSSPSAIVVVVPWIYNLLKSHPTCTFMIHRDILEDHVISNKACEISKDSFRMAENDPMQTNAEESSLWEIQSLQSHYHPNVATIAKIMSEQFTKQSYNLEDFLDHSYDSMLNAELSKDIRKPPIVEYNIPRQIFSIHDGKSRESHSLDSLIPDHWDFPM